LRKLEAATLIAGEPQYQLQLPKKSHPSAGAEINRLASTAGTGSAETASKEITVRITSALFMVNFPNATFT
jgi:hypothetical protein